uniref:C2H2-type domain-containing protein n=1 Tax=Lepeophtheirus salmonis TaxID=72036 RepID=A0A0K2UZT1_LEPSM
MNEDFLEENYSRKEDRGIGAFLANTCYCDYNHHHGEELDQLVFEDSSKSKEEMDLALDELLSDFHSYQPLPSPDVDEEANEMCTSTPISKESSHLLLDSLSPPSPPPLPLPKSPIDDDNIILPPPVDFRDEEPTIYNIPSSCSPSLLLQALTPKSQKHKSTTDLLINEINELSELLPWKGRPPQYSEKTKVLSLSSPLSPHSNNSKFSQGGNTRLCIISKRDETSELDSGIESIESLSPKEFDFSPACSPAGSKTINNNSSFLTSLLSTPPETTKSGIILSSLLNQSTTSELVSPILESAPSTNAPIHTFLQTKDIFNPPEAPVEENHSSNSCWTTVETDNSLGPMQESTYSNESNKSGHHVASTSAWSRGVNLEPKDLKCDLCLLTGFSSESSLQNHKEVLHPIETQGKKVHSGSSLNQKKKAHCKDFFCHNCKMSLGSAQKYEKHMKSHGRNKEFKCEICGKEFMIKKNLTLHYKLHSIQKEFTCTICFKSYQSKSGFNIHMKQIHPQEASQQHDLSLTSIYNEDPNPSEIPSVRIEDKNNDSLVISASTQRNESVRSNSSNICSGKLKGVSIACENCKKSFKSKKTLLKHIEKGSCKPFKSPSSSSSWGPPPSSEDLLQTIHSIELNQLLF